MTERERIARIRAIFGNGIGDDAAILDPGARKLVFSIDEQIEGTHFRRDLLTLEDVGYRAFTAAASDLAAMGAEPYCALVALALPADLDEPSFEAILSGVRTASEGTKCAVVGGNLARGPVLSVTTAVLGKCAHPLTRSGARVGDGVYIVGALGEAAAGFRALENRIGVAESILSAWRRPQARIAAGLVANGRATAAIDVSDGLARDASHIAEASSVRIVLDRDALTRRTSPALRDACEKLAEDPMTFILGGGEDYALLCMSREPLAGFDRIGEVMEGAGVFLNDRPVDAGFDHFT